MQNIQKWFEIRNYELNYQRKSGIIKFNFLKCITLFSIWKCMRVVHKFRLIWNNSLCASYLQHLIQLWWNQHNFFILRGEYEICKTSDVCMSQVLLITLIKCFIKEQDSFLRIKLQSNTDTRHSDLTIN